MRFFAALLVLFGSLLLARAAPSPACEFNGEDVNGLCSCYSGYTGDTCGDNGGFLACSPLPTVSKLATEPVAEFLGNNSTVSNDVLTLIIDSPARSGRYFSSITINPNNVNCSYPGSHFVKTFASGECMDVFTGSFAIPELKDECDFQETAPSVGNDFHTILSGHVQVTAVDFVDTFRGHAIHRTTTSSLAIEISLPSFYNLSTSPLTIISPINTLAAVTLQEYDPTTDVATIEITTSVQWPYQLLTPSLSMTMFQSVNTTVEISDVECDQTNNNNPACLQVVTLTFIDFRLSSRVCTFDGHYELTWNYGCRSGQSGCPLDGSEEIQIGFDLTSGDICEKIDVVATIGGDLDSYTSEEFTEARTVIIAGTRIYLKAAISADVTISSISVKEIRIVNNGEATIIVQNDNAVLGFNAIAYDGNAGSAVINDNEKGMSFLATRGPNPQEGDIFSDATEDVVAFTIEVDVIVTYRTTFGRKRDVSSTAMSFATQAVLLAPKKN